MDPKGEHPYSALRSATLGRRVTRQAALVVMVAIATGVAITIAAAPGAAKTAPGGTAPFWAGADISTAHAAEGRMHLTATFRRAGAYIAVFVPGHVTPNGHSRGTHVVQLGHHSEGTEHVSIQLRPIPPGPWSLFIGLNPLHHAVEFLNKPRGAATWAYFTKSASGEVTVGRIVTP